MSKKDLGDGVFAEYLPNHTIKLSVTTYDDVWRISGTHTIILEPNQLIALGLWALKEAKAHGG